MFDLTADEQFFHDHAGWSHGVDERPEAGRVHGARRLAVAEQRSRDLCWRVVWEQDDIRVNHPDDEVPPQTCEQAVLLDADDEVRAILGCVDDPSEAYRRVVAAELAQGVLAGPVS